MTRGHLIQRSGSAIGGAAFLYTCGRRRRCIVPKKTNVKENKTMKKKVVAMFLAAVMALSLVGLRQQER